MRAPVDAQVARCRTPAVASPSSSPASTSSITARLLRGRRAALREAGVAAGRTSRRSSVPGAFEMPQAARCARRDRPLRRDRLPRLRDSRRDAALRVHRRRRRARLMQAAAETGVPMAFGVLTTDTWEQAEARAGDGPRQQGLRSGARRPRDGAAVRQLGCADGGAGDEAGAEATARRRGARSRAADALSVGESGARSRGRRRSLT